VRALAVSLAAPPARAAAADTASGAPHPHAPAGEAVAGAPLPHEPAAEAVAGALLHTVRCHLAGDCLALLEAVGEQLAYAALAPALGPARAAEVALSRP
jgi:hypothetical protein